MRRSSSPLRKRTRPEQSPQNDTKAQSAPSLPPLSLSILGIEPLDEFIKTIADFVHHTIQTRPEGLNGHIEVEAKVGILCDRSTNQRLALPVIVETILTQDSIDIRFESNMSPQQHKHYNNLLNNLRPAPVAPSYSPTPLVYHHLYLVDSFYSSEGNDRDKIRVTRDQKTGNVIEIMRKVRLGDLNIYCPKRPADWRVSVNLEIPVSHPLGSPTHTRTKDRMSYSHEEFTIDLTKVTSSTSGRDSNPQTSHELEIEITRPELLLATAIKRNDQHCSEHERSAYDELIRAFVNNARILVRNATEEWH